MSPLERLRKKDEEIYSLREALERAEARLVALYSAINPHANYTDELTFAGHKSGNRLADKDEVVVAIRETLGGR